MKLLSSDTHVRTLKLRGRGRHHCEEIYSEVHIELRAFVKKMTLEEIEVLRASMENGTPLHLTLSDTPW